MRFLPNKIFTIILLLLLFVGCASNQKRYAREDYSQDKLVPIDTWAGEEKGKFGKETNINVSLPIAILTRNVLRACSSINYSMYDL